MGTAASGNRLCRHAGWFCATSPSNLSHVRSLHQRILEMIKKTFSSKKQLFSNSLVPFYVDKQKITCNSRWAVRASTCRFSASCCPHPINTRTPLRQLNPCLLGSILPCRHTRLNSQRTQSTQLRYFLNAFNSLLYPPSALQRAPAPMLHGPRGAQILPPRVGLAAQLHPPPRAASPPVGRPFPCTPAQYT